MTKEGQMNMAHRAIVSSIFGLVASSDYVLANTTRQQQLEIVCQLWQANIKPGQPLTDALRQQARVIPPNGVVTLEYRTGRRTILDGQ